MYKITKYDKEIDDLVDLKKLADKAYKKNEVFFGTNIKSFEIKFFYTRKSFNESLNQNNTPDWKVGVDKNRQVLIFSPNVFESVSSHSKSEFEGVLAHEITHIFKDDLFKFINPIWLSEGISGYISGQYKKVTDYQFTDFKNLHSRKGWNKNPNYTQSYLFTSFLIGEFGKEKMIKLFRSLGREGIYLDFLANFKEIFEKSFNEVVEGWKKLQPVLKFVYSYSYENSLLGLKGEKLTVDHTAQALDRKKMAQRLWNQYEEKIFELFDEIYRIDIKENNIEAFVSLALSLSYSHPLTIGLKHFSDLDKNDKTQRGFVYRVIHELAHYFMYTRSKENFTNRLHLKIQKKDLLNDHGANLHYLIQAVEFGIISEVFGFKYADYWRNWIIEKSANNEYGKSAKLLKEHDVPMNKECLEYIKNNVLIK